MFFVLSTLTSRATIFVILHSVSNNHFFENSKAFVNHIRLIFTLYVYKFRQKILININNLIAEIQKIQRIKKESFFINLKETAPNR